MVLCEDCQSQTLFVVHVLKILTTYIDRSQFNYIQRVKQSQMTHFSTKNWGAGKFFTIVAIVHWNFVTIVNQTENEMKMKLKYLTRSHN